jgi:Fe-S-cluster containining protein
MADVKTITSEDFQCVHCGVCCRTQKVVLLTLADVFRMADRLNIRPGAFYRRYCMKSERFSDEGLLRIYLKTDGGCPFAKDGRCSVHDFKPVVCARSPFYYIESSLAVLKVVGVIVPGCSFDRISCDTVARGDRERLIDMEIEVSITDDYMQVSGKFDEQTARIYYERMKEALADGGSRAMAYQKLLDESMRREDHYRNDPYYKGATSMYLSGFFNEFKEEVARMTCLHPGLLTFEPSAVGTVGGDVVVALQDKEYNEVKRRLEGKDGDVVFRTSSQDGFEYALVTIATEGRPAAFFYYYLEAGKKPGLKHTPGKVSITFMNSRREAFVFTGADRAGWLS